MRLENDKKERPQNHNENQLTLQRKEESRKDDNSKRGITNASVNNTIYYREDVCQDVAYNKCSRSIGYFF